MKKRKCLFLYNAKYTCKFNPLLHINVEIFNTRFRIIKWWRKTICQIFFLVFCRSCVPSLIKFNFCVCVHLAIKLAVKFGREISAARADGVICSLVYYFRRPFQFLRKPLGCVVQYLCPKSSILTFPNNILYCGFTSNSPAGPY